MEGLALAFDLTLQSFLLASDNANVLCLGKEGMCSYGQVAKEVRARDRGFIYVDFAHESRNMNIDAHNLARRK
jgi:hypothetical protein